MAPSLDFETYPRARGVFHEVLLAHLNERGASTMEELEVSEFGWQSLPFDREETTEILESARRHGLIAPLGQTVDGHERRVQGVEWAPTVRGATLSRPKGISRRDLLAGVAQGPRVFRKTYTDLLTLAAFVVGAATLNSLTDHWTVRLGAACAVVIVLVSLAVARGTRGEHRIRDAAEAWPRLKELRPLLYKWQRHSVARFWFLIGVVLLVIATLTLSWTDVTNDVVGGLGISAASISYAWVRLRQHEVQQEVGLSPLTDFAANLQRTASGPD